MNFKLFLWIVVLFTFKASAHRHTAYSHDGQSQLDNRNWMSYLDPKTPLRELSLPGTHDSMARYFKASFIADYVSCQILTLSTQLRAGIRVFDIRCRHIANVFTIHHGSIYLGTCFDNVMIEMVNFLNQNPSETLLVRIKEEYSPEGNTRTFEDTFLDYRSKYANYIWASIKENPTLEEVRGKIVILQEFEGSKLYGLDYSSFLTQDYYDLNDNWSLYYKWLKVKEKLISANKEVGTGFHVNYLSGSFKKGKGPVFPYFVASGHSSPGTSAPRLSTGATTPGWKSKYPDFPRVACFIGICTIAFEGTNILTYEYIEKNQCIRFVGIIMMDFPGDGLINAIINLNYPTLFYIQNIDTGLVLDLDLDVWKKDGLGEIIMYPYHGGSNQLWKYKSGMIFSMHNRFVLDIDGRNERRLITYPLHGGTNQLWHFDWDHTVRSGTGHVLDVEGANRDVGAHVIAFKRNGGFNQRFKRVFVSLNSMLNDRKVQF